jgi:DNA-binding MarR family transcriptional regulator
MTPRSTAAGDHARNGRQPSVPATDARAADGRAPAGAAGVTGDQATRVWAAMRRLVGGHPTKQLMRDALDLGRGSGRVRSLMWLSGGPLSLSGLAEAVGVDAPYATLIVDSLEERGLVERQPDPDDRRRKLVSLTPAGSEAVDRVLRIQEQPPAAFGSLSPAELDTLEGLLRRLASESRPG